MKITRCVLTIIAGMCVSYTAFAASVNIEKKVDELLSKMTLEEKIGQMNQISATPDISLFAEAIKAGNVGSMLNLVDPVAINKAQEIAVKQSRLHIPILMSRDVVHGYRTMFPIPLGQAATFNPAVAERGGRVAAIEASADGIRWTFAPMIDIARDPRWGRIAESCGEDPYLTSVMGSAMIKGFQGKSLSDPSSIAACAKHFVGYGAAEGGRDYNSTSITERLLRNVYLIPFKAAVDAGCATFMSSFNDNDGVPATANTFSLKKILRGEWKYDGMVVSDWNSIAEMINHGFCADKKEAAYKAINAGVDMDMVSESYLENLKQLLKDKKVSMETIDNTVRNILRLKFRLGLFENPYVDTKKTVAYQPEFLQSAKEAAVQSAILLKNDNNLLPLKSNVKTIAIVGPMADAKYDQMGTWAFDGEKTHTQTPVMAFEKMYGNKIKIIYEPGLTYSRDTDEAGIKRAVEAAKKADVVIAFVGEEAILSGEAHCLVNLNLKGSQTQLIDELSKTGKPLVTVFMAGRPLTIENEVKASTSVLYMFHPGTMGGPAIADLVFGKSVPSGKTPVTFPKAVGQIPIYYAHNNTGRPAMGSETLIENIPIEAGQTSLGCTSFYLDCGFGPLFPFGYGLSYTTFKYTNLQCKSVALSSNSQLEVSADITNTGDYEATEVAQMYVQDKVGSVTRPLKELKAFSRVTLKPGETKSVTFNIPVSDLSFWNIDMKYGVEPGDFRLWVGANSDDEGLSVDFTVE